MRGLLPRWQARDPANHLRADRVGAVVLLAGAAKRSRHFHSNRRFRRVMPPVRRAAHTTLPAGPRTACRVIPVGRLLRVCDPAVAPRAAQPPMRAESSASALLAYFAISRSP